MYLFKYTLLLFVEMHKQKTTIFKDYLYKEYHFQAKSVVFGGHF